MNVTRNLESRNLERKVEDAHQRSILSYWRAIELLTPPVIEPKPVQLKQTGPKYVVDLNEDEAPPWQTVAPCPGHQWQHQVYCGVYSVNSFRSALEGVLGSDSEVFMRDPSEDTCVFAYTIVGQGSEAYILKSSCVITTSAWALGRVLNSDSDAIEHSFMRAKQEIDILQRCIDLGDIYPKIKKATYELVQHLGLDRFLPHIAIRVASTLGKTTEKGSRPLFNSFFVDDLNRLLKPEGLLNIGNGLRRFLTSDPGDFGVDKVDVRKTPRVVFDGLAPSLFPRGCWPAPDYQPLVSAQQFAVNTIFRNLIDQPGLLSINGPPGTGKTTLLRDIIAGIVVERARCLATLARPTDAFCGQKKVEGPNCGDWHIALWRQKFFGFEIVVASSNNEAVNNITREIPAEEVVDRNCVAGLDYFKSVANLLVSHTGKENKKGWAPIATSLGNQANCQKFCEVWNEEATGLAHCIESLEETDWVEAGKRFQTAIKAEESLREELQSVYEVMVTIEGLKARISELTASNFELTFDLADLQMEIDGFLADLDDETKKIATLEEGRVRHHRFFPPLLHIVFTLLKAYKEWCQKDRWFIDAIDKGVTVVKWLERELCRRKKDKAPVDDRYNRAVAELEANKAQLVMLRDRLTLARKKHDCIPDDDWGSQTSSERELSKPWASLSWRKARANLFIEALRLHKAFIAGNKKVFVDNLRFLTRCILSGETLKASQDAIRSAWTTLFFVIPVISTTFASVSRLLFHFDSERIGWLMIDEAGQASPQASVGAIWRSKRTVVVGDPMQLTPIVIIPFSVQHSLAKRYGVANIWAPGTSSVQKLADRVSQYGTELRAEADPLWVSIPLTVHRRCGLLMFRFINEVVYDGLMIHQTSRDSYSLDPSNWYHVASNQDLDISQSGQHWIDEEESEVSRLLEKLAAAGIEGRKIFLISPFKSVVQRLKDLPVAKSLKGITTGTVHTVQGKEADIVILALGGRTAGARTWASRTPHLLNVAVSRAKKRLYVIGDRDQWRKYPFFQELSELMGKH